jgi:UDP-glucose:(heptosyl)LPS alpha-1,3-glucosyltransferase
VKVALVLHHVRPTGGQDRYALELARHLAASVPVTIVAMRISGDLPASVEVHRVRPAVANLLMRAAIFRRGAGRFLRGRKFDVIHALGGAWPGATVITAPFCHAAWKTTSPPRHPYQRMVTAQGMNDERRAYRHPDLRAIIAVSRRTADELRHYYGPLSAPITVIPNGVDLERFRPEARSERARARLLFVGAWDRKGLEVAVRALAAMRHGAELLAIGDGPRSRYTALARELGVADRVRLERPRDRIEEAMADADLLLFPTTYEPFGMVIAESLAAGTPVVTTRLAGAAELIASEDAGAVIDDPADWAAFAAACDRLLDRAPGGAARAGATREAVLGLGWDRIAERTLAVYRETS